MASEIPHRSNTSAGSNVTRRTGPLSVTLCGSSPSGSHAGLLYDDRVAPPGLDDDGAPEFDVLPTIDGTDQVAWGDATDLTGQRHAFGPVPAAGFTLACIMGASVGKLASLG